MTHETEKHAHPIARGLAAFAGLTLAAKAAWILYSRRYIDHHAKLRGVLSAEQHTFDSPTAGKINFYVDKVGEGTPILILHGIHPTAGVQDVIPIFNAFKTHRPVYAINLPGFGGSEKTDRPYRPSLYQAAITEFIRDQIGQAADMVALGLSAEFAALAACENPELVESLILINPTGMQMPQSTGSIAERSRWGDVQNLVYSLMAVPLWSLPLYDILASRARVEQYYHNRFEYAVPSDLIDLAYTSGHQPGAHFAPLVALSGKLYTPNVREKVYAALKLPVMVLYDNEPNTHFEMLPFFVREHPNWQALRVRQSRGMPHFDRPGETFRAMDLFWNKQSE